MRLLVVLLAALQPVLPPIPTGFWDATDVTMLSVDRAHPSDSISVATPDKDVYILRAVEAASIQPFCLSANSGADLLWSQCFRAGYIQKQLSIKHPGGDGAAITLSLTNPVAGASRLKVLARITVDKELPETLKGVLK